MTGKPSIRFEGNFHIDDIKQYQGFREIYDVESLTFMNNNRKELKPKQERVCRFCGKSFPDTTFNKISHLVPQLIGNKDLISDFECDSCNHFFSKYENSLANYLGLLRTLFVKKGQEGIPTYKSPEKNIVIREDKLKKGTLLIEDNNNESLIFNDIENKRFIINSTKHSYVPIHVFKCLLKVAISLIKNDLSDYTQTIDFLMSEKNTLDSNPLLILHKYFIPGPPFPTPYIFSCVKRTVLNNEPFPTRTIIISFHNFVYQIFVPFVSKDINLKTMNLCIMPPFIDKDWIEEYGRPKAEVDDLSTSLKRKGINEEITIKYI